MVNFFQFVRVVLLGVVWLALDAWAAKPVRPSTQAPVQVAAIEYGPNGARPVILQVATPRVQWSGAWRQDAAVAHLSWAPDGAFLLYREGDRLMRQDMKGGRSLTVSEGLSMPRTRPDYVLRPDGRQVAVRLATGRINLLPLEQHGESNAEASQVDPPSGCFPSSLPWQTDGRALWILCGRGDSKAAPPLLKLEPATSALTARPVPEVAELLGWSAQEGLLVAGKADASGQRPGRVAEDGSYRPLRSEPSDTGEQESPSVDFVQGYLPSIDSFVMARATENPSDPVVLSLVTPGDAPRDVGSRPIDAWAHCPWGIPGCGLPSSIASHLIVATWVISTS